MTNNGSRATDWDHTPAEPDWWQEERREAFAALGDGWWAEHEHGQAIKEAAATQPSRPDPEEQPEYQSPEEELEASLLRGSDILNIPPPDPLVTGWLNLDSVAVMYGPPKKGKSFVAIDLALCVATGNWWHKHKVEKGAVLYVIAEGVRGIGKRVAAWSKVNRTPVPDNLVWLPRPVSLLNSQWSGALAAVAARLRPSLVIIDTLNRSMVGGDENSSKDMGTVIAAADLIKRTTGACVLIIHHSGKNAEAGARGHSSLLGALDTELEVKSAEGVITLTNSEQKDDATAPPQRFALVAAEGTNSVAVAPHAGFLGDNGRTLSQGCADALKVLQEIQVPGGISPGKWESVGDIPHSSFYRYVPRLLDLGLIVNVGTEKQPRYVTTDEADEDWVA